MRKLIALTLLMPLAATAGSFEERLAEGHKQVRGGDADSALATYQDLLTDEPDSAVVRYHLGLAQYRRALGEIELEASEDAIASLGEARESFLDAATGSERRVRADAAYNAANAQALAAKELARLGNHEATLTAFREAVEGYENLLRRYPDDERARHNLDHIRYTLKRMLQNPPPPQEQQKGGDDKKKDQGEDEQKQKQDQQPEQDPKQEDGQQQEQQENGDQQQEQEREEKQQQGQQEEREPQDLQNVEALLQSLEDIDKNEQAKMRRVPGRLQIPRSWW